LLEGLVKPFSRGYDTGSGDTGQYEYISGSSIYRFSGGTGGTFEQFNGIEFYPTTVDNIYNVTQSWDESFSTTLGTVIYDRDDQREFYNGEFSGSDPHVKLQRGLGNGDDPCAATLKINPNEFYVYQLQFFSGSDNNYTITSGSIPSSTTTTTTTTTTAGPTTTTTTTTIAPTLYYTLNPCNGGDPLFDTTITPILANQRYIDPISGNKWVWDNNAGTVLPQQTVNSSLQIVSGQINCA
jgi:hypothetical protein